jgi:GTP-binding protein
MSIRTAKFVTSIVGPDKLLADKNFPQIAFIGRSNAGKSSIINSLTNQAGLAKTSSFPGRTQQINLFLINKAFYLVDLPGYGYAKLSHEARAQLEALLNWYFFESGYEQKKAVLIIDASLGPTESDLEMLHALMQHEKNIIVVANKIDKIKNSHYDEQMKKIAGQIGDHPIIPYSSEARFGMNELYKEILK